MKIFSFFFLLAFLAPSGAAGLEPSLSSEEIFKAIVKIHVTVPADALSASALGVEREGTGIVIDKKGHILTVGSLVIDAKSIEISDLEKKAVKADLVDYDHTTGFALLQSEPLSVAPLKLGQSSQIENDEPLLVLGFEGGNSAILTRFIGRQEYVGNAEYIIEDAIFTVPAKPDIAGDALINSKGELVGIGAFNVRYVILGWGEVVGNIFMPTDLLNPILEDLKSGTCSKKTFPWLGVNAEEIHQKVIVTDVTLGGPAEKAGLQHGDVILAVNGLAVAGLADFYRKVWDLGMAGVEVPIMVLQGEQIKRMKLESIDNKIFLLKNGNPTLCAIQTEEDRTSLNFGKGLLSWHIGK